MENILLDFEPLKIDSSRTSGAASISIVNTENNGRRIKISKRALEIIGNPGEIQLGINKTSIIIAAELPDYPNCFKLSEYCIYNSPLVLKITEQFNLDYSEGRTSFSFTDAQILELSPGKNALIFRII